MSKSFPRSSYKHLCTSKRQYRRRPLRPMLEVRAERTARTVAMANGHLQLAERGHPDAEEYRARAEKMLRCNQQLKLSDKVDEDGNVRTRAKSTYRCNQRNCQNCDADRRLRIIRNIRQIFAELFVRHLGLRLLFLTLTVPNVTGDRLAETIDAMNEAFTRLVRMKRWQNAVVGWLRVLEVTWSAKHGNTHPHFHCLILVNGATYFKGADYIDQPGWKQLWGKAYGVDNPIVDIRAPNPRGSESTFDQAIAQALKYPWKSAEFTEETVEGFRVDPDVLDIFHKAMKGKRTYAFGGLIRDVAKDLKVKNLDGDQLPGEGDHADDWLVDLEAELPLPLPHDDEPLAVRAVRYEQGSLWHRPAYVPDTSKPDKE